MGLHSQKTYNYGHEKVNFSTLWSGDMFVNDASELFLKINPIKYDYGADKRNANAVLLMTGEFTDIPADKKVTVVDVDISIRG